MRHRIAGRSLGRTTSHRMALYKNLTRDLLFREYIVTTEAKAKEMRSFTERIITLGKDGSLAARRKALKFAPARIFLNFLSSGEWLECFKTLQRCVF